ncbi:MAG: hypothetical protein A3J83_07165, partial [Elusimicrobia bacterium RIFOXYA2_FULL_40_6]
LFQEVFLSVFNSIKNYRGDSEFFTWLYRIAHNLFINFTKKSHRKVLSLDYSQTENDEDRPNTEIESPKTEEPQEMINDTLFSDKIYAALNQLDVKFRMPVIFIHIEEFTYDEAAKIMNEPIGTVKSRLNRGQKMLKEILEKDEPH